MKTILLTGASGYLGSYLLKALLKEGYNVIILKRSTSDLSKIQSEISLIDSFSIDECSLETPFLKYKKIDAIIHTATLYGRNDEKQSELVKANTLFPMRLLELANHYKSSVFINTDTFSTKSSSYCTHLGAYALTKKYFTELGKGFTVNHDISFINMKLEHVYGPNEALSKFNGQIFHALLSNEEHLKLTPGQQRRDFIYIDDVVEAFLTVLNSDFPREKFLEFEVGTGYSTSIKEFVKLAAKLTHSKTVLHFGAIPYRVNEMKESKADNGGLVNLGWYPKYELRKGITEIIEHDQNKKSIN